MSDTDSPDLTVELNDKKYELNESVREDIVERAQREYEENDMFSCWWKVATADDAEDSDIHEVGDPILVIETSGPMVPWEKLDQLNVEMQEVGPQSQLDDMAGSGDQQDNGNGVKTVDIDDAEKDMGRTHFGLTPQNYEEVPGPDGEEADKIPPKPEQMGDDPMMVWWVPDHPDLNHTWSAGEAITKMHSWVEWNVQTKANQPSLANEKPTSHDHWESILQMHDCDVVAKMAPAQNPPDDGQGSDSDDSPEPLDGKAGGNNWNV